MTRQQCYHILELPPEANITEVKAAYRRLAKRWHPDRFAAHTAEQHQALERFYAITCAYQTLQATPTLPRPSPRQPAWLPHWCSKHWHTR
ncbi:MAG: J domain-containing protein, partial [Candidatus Tectomicrobia bacterium]|nr:J domain-containing protein [Candidatus Tectomicrobia bacterium]